MEVKKADGTNRSRLVAKEMNADNAPELFAATPPIESLEYRIRRAAQKHESYNMHVDVTRAYFYAQASRDIDVELPVDDIEPGERRSAASF